MTYAASTPPAPDFRLPLGLRIRRWLPGIFSTLVVLAGFWLTTAIYVAGEIWFAMAALLLTTLTAYVFLTNKAYAIRWIFPAMAALALFVALPLGYTFYVGFTNYGGENLLTQERVQRQLLGETYVAEGSAGWKFSLHQSGEALRIVLDDPASDRLMASTPFTAAALPEAVDLAPADAADLGEKLSLRDVIANRDALQRISATLPDGTELRMAGLRDWAALRPAYSLNDDGSLTDIRSGERILANTETGFFERPDGDRLSPGFRVFVGWENYVKIFTFQGIWQPFVDIFIWNMTLAAVTTAVVFTLGLALGSVLTWPKLQGRTAYRLLLILPYAVPNFVSIQVFRGLFNQEFGEINLLLNGLFGIKPEWLTDPFLAKVMVLLVNFWLGYPYMLILASSFLQAIPRDLYEASAIEKAGPFHNFTRITLPIVIKPFLPLLIAAFAFNFNNFVLIALLTQGRPDMIGTMVPAGETDILVTYTYRIAFQTSTPDYGLAAAISVLIFLLVGALAAVNIWLTAKRAKSDFQKEF